jgi:restriction endonuclease
VGELSPDTVAFWLVQDAQNLTFRPLLDITVEVLAVRTSSFSAEQRAEQAEKLLQKISSSLNRIAFELLEDGVEPSFEVSDADESFYFRSLESQAIKFRDQLLALRPNEFERFCARILENFGAESRVTGQSGDGGIDFVGRNFVLTGKGSPSPTGARALVVGQAKRYAKELLIGEKELRAFVGGAIRRISDPQDQIAYRSAALAPLSFAFWTTSDFHPSAKRYARAVGLWYLNGVGLAQLALRLGVPANT